MGIYLPNMEMTIDGNETIIRIQPDGTVLDQYGHHLATTAVPVPPHGDLVDLKAPFKALYFDEMTEEWEEKMVTVGDVLYSCMVDEMPPITIPAEEGE